MFRSPTTSAFHRQRGHKGFPRVGNAPADPHTPLGSQIGAESEFLGDPLIPPVRGRMTANQMYAALPEPRPATEEISGLIERVTFHNDQNGFCVLRVKMPGHREETTRVSAVI